jgi:hypothetical protein
LGIVRLLSRDFSNAQIPIVVTELPSVNDVSGAQKKAYVPIELTELGIISDVTEVDAKALSPIVVIELPRVSEVSGESKKAESPIDITESGIVTDLRPPDKRDPKLKAPAPMVRTRGSMTRVPAQFSPLITLKLEVKRVYESPVHKISSDPFAFALGTDMKLVNNVRRTDATIEMCK